MDASSCACNSQLLAEGQVLKSYRILASSEQPYEPKQTEEDCEHVARFFLLSD